MKQLLFLLLLLPVACSVSVNTSDHKRYKEQASRVTIYRDNWGIPHIYGETDADAVFGLMYAQCEESFERVERAYIEKFGRLAETEGESRLYDDLKTKLIYDTSAAIEDYYKSPAWLKKLLQAFADGINYYIYTHPETKPALLTHFEPWFPLMFTDGGYTATQTGGLETEDVKSIYPLPATIKESAFHSPTSPVFDQNGSNGFAIGPAKTASKNALLYINPHVSFYFRTEAHMVSDEGLNAYGAVTWGQFFVFQGFNEHLGWMHTSSLADASDLYADHVIQKGNSFFYEYEGRLKTVTQKQLILRYKKQHDVLSCSITTYYTHHGPVAGERDGKWLSLKEHNRSLNGLIQSWQLTKATNFNAFKKQMELLSNSSTNTVYADDKGNIAYWHGNFIPKRDERFDWSLPVDGSTTATEWKGIHSLNEIIHLYNPNNGWLQNCNSTPFSASGIHALEKKNYPAYMAPDGENFRSLFAMKEIGKENNFTLDKLIALGYNHYLAAFDSMLPPLFEAYDVLTAKDSMKLLLKEPVALLKAWDKKSAVSSIATTLAIEWAYALFNTPYINHTNEEISDQVTLFTSFVKNTPPQKRLELLLSVIKTLESKYATWKKPWGDINRFQRLSGSIYPTFDDNKKSLPVGMASSLFGSLPAYETIGYNVEKEYGVAGNSFVAAVEFGSRVKALSVRAGGQSFKPTSKHFTDQSSLFIEGKLKEVLFYKEDVLKGSERKYRPGD